jgi:hypothetical protein
MQNLFEVTQTLPYAAILGFPIVNLVLIFSNYYRSSVMSSSLSFTNVGATTFIGADMPKVRIPSHHAVASSVSIPANR